MQCQQLAQFRIPNLLLSERGNLSQKLIFLSQLPNCCCGCRLGHLTDRNEVVGPRPNHYGNQNAILKF